MIKTEYMNDSLIPHNVLGIDIGFSGAIVWYQDGKIVDVFDMPIEKVKGKTQLVYSTLKSFLRIFKSTSGYNTSIAYVEHVASMPGQGVSSMFRFGFQAGVIRGMLEAYNFDVRIITPQTWKRQFNLIGKEKQASIETAKQWLPTMTEHLTLKKHHGRADAALIAWAGMLCDGYI